MLAPVHRTRWGGIANGRFQASGFFRVDRAKGVFWLVDPDGGRFLSKGVNTVKFDQDQIRDSDRSPYAEACRRKYGNEDAWRTAVAGRLAGWGFNSVGSWSDEAVAAAGPTPLAVTPNLDLGMSFAWQKNEQDRNGPRQEFPDVFDPAFVLHVQRRANELCAQRSAEPNIIGWFIDNELRWGPDWRGPDDLLPLFLNLPAATPGHIAAVDFLRKRHPDGEAFNASDCDAFVALLAERYFALTTAAIKAVDAHHLVLGSRFAYPPRPPVVAAAGRYADIVSFNCYDLDPAAAIDAYAVTDKPCLLGEFSFRAADSGLPNTIGAGPKVASQAERAASFRHYVTTALRRPALVGYHWFEHADQPAEGRFDGENSNFGTVTIDDCVYEELTRAMISVNAEAEELHATAARAGA
jgi:agarase